MKTIELLVNKPEFLKGSIITVDDVSAAALIGKEEAKPYEPTEDGGEDTDAAQPKVKRGRRSRGTSQSVNVAEADMPNTEADTGDGEVDGEGGVENV
ncbi:Uncharacterised protein [Mycobacteroides abscessus]|uniref:hypothetical protein n=2 Tax=Mycobacteroides abscessus TaxID=36809 RepID=UPI0005DB9D52|nr:hypothetical protein [Mycobacteroides abscessus]PVB12957.1 hypothetical protein DDJ68_22075 [Mycobacteroides abscessus]RIR99549.1 hypothetical protein D2E57_02615 [Mycobacteroides abscessus]RIT46096.1 hypothetical protein D2E98_07615 [Mycobacteroides abscessus]CPR90207.1 Uncharacterised protein [Mycobacteroides abscessus]CPU82799.1 Uncharacterised protein [Mycobacteroides abscessus]